MAIVLHHSKAQGTDKVVLLGIANHDGDGGAWPKVATLAKYANVHPRTVVRSLNKLGELGEIAIFNQQGGNRQTPDYARPNQYELLLECPPECDRTKNHRIDGERLTREPKAPKEPVDNALFDPVTPASPGDVHVTTPSDAHVTPPSDAHVTPKNHHSEPPVELSSTSPADSQRCRACRQTGPKRSGGYCAQCESLGRHERFISCSGCGSARRRIHPMQDKFTCAPCKAKEAGNEEVPKS